MTTAIVLSLALVIAATYDIVAGAFVAGVFSVINTFISAHLLREQRRTRNEVSHARDEVSHARAEIADTATELADTRHVLEQPRRIVYDREGEAVGFLVCSAPDMEVVTEAGRSRRELAQDDHREGTP